MSLKEHWQAFALAAASSADNFLVGLSVGLGGHVLSMLVLWGTSTCNALGALVATASGGWVQEQLQDGSLLPSLAASAAFGYLAWQEYRDASHDDSSDRNDDDATATTQQNSSLRALAELSLPMTLNNLAGGVAGGVVGVSPVVASFHVWWVSLFFMWIGHRLGFAASRKEKKKTSHSLSGWSVMLYVLLSLQSLVQALWAD